MAWYELLALYNTHGYAITISRVGEEDLYPVFLGRRKLDVVSGARIYDLLFDVAVKRGLLDDRIVGTG